MTMTNKEKYKQAFGVLHASGTIPLGESRKKSDVMDLEKGMVIDMKRKFFNSKFAAACIGVAVVLAAGATAYAYGGELISNIFGWGNNFEIRETVDENGDTTTEGILYTEDLTEPVVIQDGRMIFIVNDQQTDITALVSETKAYTYEYADEEGNTHIWLVGLNSGSIEDYGYGEFIKDADGEWVGGYSTGISLEEDGGTSAQWYNEAKKELNIPW